jgi:hypothetical protein
VWPLFILEAVLSTVRNRIFSAALLLPLVLFSAVSTSFRLWRCQDGVARSACCCPGKAPGDVAAAADVTAALSRPGCCDIEQHEVNKAPVETARGKTAQTATAGLASLATIPLALLSPLPLPDLRAKVLPLPGKDPPSGRDLVVQKQSFLI